MVETCKPDDPDGLQRAIDRHEEEFTRQLVGAIHSEQQLLEIAVTIPHHETKQGILRVVFDHLYMTCESFKELAVKFTSEEEFPDRTDRWPAFFKDDTDNGDRIEWLEKDI